VAKLEARDYADYAKTLPFKPEAFAGRKGKSDRGVLVEVFTGAECPPCAAVDLAFDGLPMAAFHAMALVGTALITVGIAVADPHVGAEAGEGDRDRAPDA